MSDQAVVIWGEVLWDLFPDGRQLGGAPANVAWHLGLAGGWARLVSRVGDDARGTRCDRAARGVGRHVARADRSRARDRRGRSRRSDGAARRSYKLVPGRAWERIACTDECREALADAGVMVFGTLAQRTPEGLAAWRDGDRARAAA